MNFLRMLFVQNGNNKKNLLSFIFMKEFNLDSTRIPKHVAIIMDGNGRWAKKKRGNENFWTY
jgi:undecaprenyl pyrophosphate synthase